MTTIFQDTGKGFSRDALRKAVAEEPVEGERETELSDLANQVAAQFEDRSVPPHIVTGVIRLFEFLGFTTIGIFVSLFSAGTEAGIQSLYVGASFLGAMLGVGFIHGMDGYRISSLRTITSQLAKGTMAVTMAMVAIMLFGLFIEAPDGFSLNWLLRWYALNVIFLAVSRLIVGRIIRKLSSDGRFDRRTVIVGGGESAAELIRSLEAQTDSDIRICGIFDDRNGKRSPAIVAGYPKLGTVPELVEFARKARINMMIVSLPLSAEKRVLQLLKQLWVLPVDIRLSAHTNKLSFRHRTYSYEGAVPLLDVFENPIANWDSVMKRCFDMLFCVTALVILSPLMIATAIAIKLDSKGPVFFRQKRHGFNNEEVGIFKFRSLYHGRGDDAGIDVVTKNDNRVTRVGRIIRKTSIDELPQLFNVLSGNLSLVGPRPHVMNAQTGNRLWNEVVDGYFARHKVKPGITGWAQINGWRGEVDRDNKIRERVNHDLYYIENWSLMLDMYILLVTPFKILNTENAY